MNVLNIANVRHDRSAWAVPVPLLAQELQTLPKVDYADAFEVQLPASTPRDPERWARAIFDLGSPLVGTLIRAIALALGARPSASTGARVRGFNVAARSAEGVCLESLTRVGLVQLVVAIETRGQGARLSLSTFIAYSGPAGRAAFERVVGNGHRHAVPLLLEHAAASAG
ncbi:MAG TPA: hypothetical protein VF137_07815 [Candidatus Dormibacteraeota bacterium]